MKDEYKIFNVSGTKKGWVLALAGCQGMQSERELSEHKNLK